MTKIRITESASPNKYTVNEPSEVDGVNILARATGPAFFPNSISGNKVFYSLESWENALAEEAFKSRLSDRKVLGTIGHDVELDDDAIRAGLPSHIVSKIWIDYDTNVGMAEYLVLNTGPGRTLNTLLRAGVKMNVSTLCEGSFKDTTSFTEANEVDPDNFYIKRIDFVLDPGYTDALPKVVESITHSNQKENNQMSENKVIELLEKQLNQITESSKTYEAEKIQLRESLNQAQAKLKIYENLGTPEELEASQEELNKFQEVAETPDLLKDVLKDAEEVVAQLTDALSTREDTISEEDQEELAKYRELADSPEVVKELVETLEQYANKSTEPSETEQKALEELAAYQELGTVEEIKDLTELTEALMLGEAKREIRESAEEANVDPDRVEILVDKGFEVEEAIEFLKEDASTEDEDEDEGELDALNEEPKTFSESLSTRFLRSLRDQNKTPISESKDMFPSQSLAQQLLQRNFRSK